MFIRKPFGFGFKEIVLVTVLGYFGGLYIWKPAFQKFAAEEKEKQSISPEAAEGQVKKPM